jgi:poly-beta-1,6-N-acetyl-D-glucosamine synthase
MSTVDELIPFKEFRSQRRAVPNLAIVILSAMTIVYAALLTIALPWTAVEAVSNGYLHVMLGSMLALYGGLILIRACIVHTLACYEHVRRMGEQPLVLARTPLVSILVPAFNESETIVSAVESLLSLRYPKYEIIVVDDGSEDDTFEKASQLAGQHGHCEVAVVRKPNGGKSSALNLALNNSSGELVLFVDADSRLDENALSLLVAKLNDTRAAAVCGQVTIRNRVNILSRFQAAEYLIGNGGMRTALSLFGLVTLVPGPIGLYRREILDQMLQVPWNEQKRVHPGNISGPLSDATFAEDFDLSLSTLAIGGRIVYEPRANAYTKCPEGMTSLISQRYRWIRGTMQVFHRYLREMQPVARQRNRPLDLLMVLLYPVDIYLSAPLNSLYWGFLAISAAAGLSLNLLFSWIAAIMLLNVMSVAVYLLAHDDEFALLPYAIAIDVYQSFLVNSAWVIALLDELRGARMRWS